MTSGIKIIVEFIKLKIPIEMEKIKSRRVFNNAKKASKLIVFILRGKKKDLFWLNLYIS